MMVLGFLGIFLSKFLNEIAILVLITIMKLENVSMVN